MKTGNDEGPRGAAPAGIALLALAILAVICCNVLGVIHWPAP